LDGAPSSSLGTELRASRDGHSGLLFEQLDPYVLEAARHEHLLPCLRRRRLLPPTSYHTASVPKNPDDACRTAFQQGDDLLHHETPVARLERQREHHVADHESPTWAQDPTSLGERKLLARVVEVVERVVRNDECRRLVLER
jgi:hypothetical protein